MSVDSNISVSSSMVNPFISKLEECNVSPVPVKSNRTKVPNTIICTDASADTYAETIVDDQGIQQYAHLAVYNVEDGTTDASLNDFRGLVVDHTTNKVICKSFPLTQEVVTTDTENLTKHIQPLLDDSTVRFFKAYEGSLLRLWCYEGVWRISTHRRLNSALSKWGHNASYHTLFLRALLPILKEKMKAKPVSWADMQDSDEESPRNKTENKNEGETMFTDYCNSLNKDSIYVFCLTSFRENRQVCNGLAPEPQLYCVGIFDRTNNFAFSFNHPSTLVPSPEEIKLDNNTVDELVTFTNEINAHEYQGVIVITADGKSAKCTNPQNDRLMKIRGNQPNVVYRYVQLRWSNDLEDFLGLYPEHTAKFEEWEKIYTHIIHNIMRKYIERYINGKTAVLPPEQYKVMTQVHQYYLNNLRVNKQHVTMEHINQIIGTWEERAVSELIAKYRERESQTGNGNRMPDTMRDGILGAIKK
jgi:hypothetical protein